MVRWNCDVELYEQEMHKIKELANIKACTV